MLAGHRAFDADDISETLAFVLTRTPAWDALPNDMPPALETFLHRCLEKDSAKRLRDIGDMRLALDGQLDASAVAGAEGGSRATLGTLVAGLLVGSLVTGVVSWMLRASPPADNAVARFVVPLPPGEEYFYHREFAVAAISPDGARIVFGAGVGGEPKLYVRELDESYAERISGTARGDAPFFSPDGEWLGYYREYGQHELLKIPVSGGTPVSIPEVERPLGASWGPDDEIFVGQGAKGIYRVSANGGGYELVVPVEPPGVAHGPRLLPDGRTLLFTLRMGGSWNDARIIAHSLESGETKVLVERGRDARYTPTGHLVYAVDGTLMAAPFDPGRAQLRGGARPIIESVFVAQLSGSASYDFSENGSLVYLRDAAASERQLVWVDRAGNEEPLPAPAREYTGPRVSPDGKRVAVAFPDENENWDVWVWDVAREAMTRFTVDPADDVSPVWSNDGARIVFQSSRRGVSNLFSRAADGTGEAVLLTESENLHEPLGFSEDGSKLLFWDLTPDAQARDLAVLDLDTLSTQVVLGSQFNEDHGTISPDGRWLAYASNESGRREVYVRPFPDVDEGKWQISTDGGDRPLWAPGQSDRSELYYRAEGGVFSVQVTTEPDFLVSRPAVVLDRSYWTGVGRNYDISPDPERFLMIKEIGRGSRELHVVLNWFSELELLVPTQ